MFEWLVTVNAYLVHVVLPAALLLALGILAIRFGTKIVKRILDKSKLEPIAVNLILKVAQTVAYVLLGLMVASKLGIDVTGIVALTSVLTLAVSLSVQDLLTNLISGFTLLYTKPFSAGHYVEIAGQGGTVQEIGLTYTKLTTPDNKVVSIPNGAVTSAQIVNYTVSGKRRVDFSIRVSYDVEPEQVMAALLQAAQVPTALADPAPFTGTMTFGDNAIEYVLQVWSATDDYWTTYFAINKNIKAVFAQKGVKFSYPHVVVHMEK